MDEAPSQKPRRGWALELALVAALLSLLAGGALAQEDAQDEAPDPARGEGEAAAEPASEEVRAHLRFKPDPAAMAPIGVRNSRTLDQYEFSVSYRYERMHFNGAANGSNHRSSDDILANFPIAPRRMDIDVHEFGLLFAPHDRITLSASLPFLQKEMKTVVGPPPATPGSQRPTLKSSGIGDLRLMALVPFMRNGAETLQVEFGLSIPTGSVTESDGQRTGFGNERLPYSMQTGSGSVDLLPGFVYRGHHRNLSWGLLARGVFRPWDNNRSYKRGTRFESSAWFANTWTDWLSSSLRLSWERESNIRSKDKAIPYLQPASDPSRQSYSLGELAPGMNLRLPFLGGHRLGLEFGWPFYQDLDGPQLKRRWRVSAGWVWDFQ